MQGEQVINVAGGSDAWENILDDDQRRVQNATYDALCQRLEEGSLEKLSDDEKRTADSFCLGRLLHAQRA